MAFCSAVTLCFASIFSLVAAALLAIAFSTDNWQVVTVRREIIKVSCRVNATFRPKRGLFDLQLQACLYNCGTQYLWFHSSMMNKTISQVVTGVCFMLGIFKIYVALKPT